MAAKRSLTTEQIKEAYARCGLSLDRVGENGEVKVRCPFHGDSNPSMNVNALTGEWYCFAGCGGGSIFAFVVRERGIDYNAAAAIIFGRKLKTNSKIRDTYEYRDEGGLLLFQAIRFEPKLKIEHELHLTGPDLVDHRSFI